MRIDPLRLRVFIREFFIIRERLVFPPEGPPETLPLRLVVPEVLRRWSEFPPSSGPLERLVCPTLRLVLRLLSFRPGVRPPLERFDMAENFLERPPGLRRPVDRRLTSGAKGFREAPFLLASFPFPVFFFFRLASASRTRQSNKQRRQMRRMSAMATMMPMERVFSGQEEKYRLK